MKTLSEIIHISPKLKELRGVYVAGRPGGYPNFYDKDMMPEQLTAEVLRRTQGMGHTSVEQICLALSDEVHRLSLLVAAAHTILKEA